MRPVLSLAALAALAVPVFVGVPVCAQAPLTVGVPVGRIPVDTWNFRQFAMSGNMYEIEAGRIAMQRARSPAVRDFAATLVSDHTRAAQALGDGMIFRFEMSQLLPRQRDALAALDNAPPRAFDLVFLDQQIAAHRMTIAIYSAYAQQGWEPFLRQAAATALPVLEDHLRAAQDIRAAMLARRGVG